MKRAIEKKNGCSCSSWSARVDRSDRPAHIFAFGKKDLITGCVCVNRLIDIPPPTLSPIVIRRSRNVAVDTKSVVVVVVVEREGVHRRRSSSTRPTAPGDARWNVWEGIERAIVARAGFGKRPGRRRRRRRGTLSVAVCCALDSFIGCRSFVST
jgi:hypothetical protein